MALFLAINFQKIKIIKYMCHANTRASLGEFKVIALKALSCVHKTYGHLRVKSYKKLRRKHHYYHTN